MSSALLKLRHYGFHVSKYGVCSTSESSVFSVMAGWDAAMLFMLFFAYNTVNTAVYEAYTRLWAFQ